MKLLNKKNTFLESHLEAAHYDPWGDPIVTKKYAQEMMDKVAILRAQNGLAGGRGKIEGFVEANGYHGKVTIKTGKIYLAKNSLSTMSNMSLAIVIYHELKHLVYHWNPNFKAMLKYSGQKRRDYEHYLIHKEISDILLNRTLNFGTRGPLNTLYLKYGWKYK